ncbi:MAG: hypothetical protein ACM3RP_01505 [Chitinophagales bacterium]
MRYLWIFLCLALVLSLAGGPAVAADPVAERIAAVVQLSPLETAMTSKMVVESYNGLVRAADTLEDPQFRAVVQGLLQKPYPSFLGGEPLDWRSYIAAGGAGAHHMYPGGLPVHTYVNLRHALNILDTYESVYGAKYNRDLVVASVLLHDVLKAYTNQYFPKFNETTGKWFVPKEVASDGLYKSWGRYGLMGHHNEMLVSELAFRGAPAVLVATAHSHQDQYWDSRSNAWLQEKDETWERTMEDGLRKLAQFPGGKEPAEKYLGEVFRPEYKSIEAGINLLSDSDWNMSQGKAGLFAVKIFAAFAEKHGLAKDSRDYNLAQGWLFSRVDPTRLSAEWERAGWNLEEAVRFVEGVFLNPAPFETRADVLAPGPRN